MFLLLAYAECGHASQSAPSLEFHRAPLRRRHAHFALLHIYRSNLVMPKAKKRQSAESNKEDSNNQEVEAKTGKRVKSELQENPKIKSENTGVKTAPSAHQDMRSLKYVGAHLSKARFLYKNLFIFFINTLNRHRWWLFECD